MGQELRGAMAPFVLLFFALFTGGCSLVGSGNSGHARKTDTQTLPADKIVENEISSAAMRVEELLLELSELQAQTGPKADSASPAPPEEVADKNLGA